MKQKLIIAVLAAAVAALAAWAMLSLRRSVEAVDRGRASLAKRAATQPAERRYVAAGTVGGRAAFAERLVGLAVDSQNNVYAAGDSEVRVFDHCARPLGRYAVSRPPQSVAVGPDGRIYVGQADQVEVLNAAGEPLETLGAGVLAGDVSAVAVVGDQLWATQFVGKADAAGPSLSRIVRFGPDGQVRGVIEGFSTPGGRLDLAATADGQVVVAHPGLHRVERYDADGTRLSSWGSFSQTDERGFCGCCNPSNVAAAPGGLVVTAEKAIPRVKVYTAAGELQAVIPAEHFNAANTAMDLAVDSGGRIYVADTAARVIRLFTPLE